MQDGSQVIERVDLVREVFPGADPQIAPDLIVGYADGYRASWATVLGQMPMDVIEDNLDRWSGTHLTAPEVVPGMFVSNRKVVDRQSLDFRHRADDSARVWLGSTEPDDGEADVW